MTNVMYHYVRPDNNEYPYFNHLNIDIFKRQLDYFEKSFGFLTKEEYIKSIRNKKNTQGVVLTFDDGFSDHIKYVLPELKKRNLWGIFYISTGVYSQQKLLNVHRVHYLKGKYGASIILKEALQIVKDHMLEKSTIAEFDKEIYKLSNYQEDEKQFRRLFNYYIKYDFLNDILDILMNKFFNEQQLVKDIYLSKKDIQSLAEEGNIIGSHSISHKVLSRLSYEEQYKEINDSFHFIDQLISQDYKSFCYPFGYKSSYNNTTLQILQELNIDDASIFDNKVQNNYIKPYELSRIDCNQFMEV